jgi:hypothetical protein
MVILSSMEVEYLKTWVVSKLKDALGKLSIEEGQICSASQHLENVF